GNGMRHHDMIPLSPLTRSKRSCGGHRKTTESDPELSSATPSGGAFDALQRAVTLVLGREEEIDAAFSMIAKCGAGALLVGGGPFVASRRSQLIGLAAFHAIPTSYNLSGFVDAGGLISYGASQTDAYCRAGIYAARILKGEKPGDLPVELPTKYELLINLRTAEALGLTVPPSLIALADRVIE